MCMVRRFVPAVPASSFKPESRELSRDRLFLERALNGTRMEQSPLSCSRRRVSSSIPLAPQIKSRTKSRPERTWVPLKEKVYIGTRKGHTRAIALSGCVVIALSGCAMTSGVMDVGNGTYMISAHASAIRGGATGANSIAYEDAHKFCDQKGLGLHPVVVDSNERDVYQSSFGGSFNQSGGSFGGGTFAAGNVNLRFKCEK